MTDDRTIDEQLHVQSQERGKGLWWEFLSKYSLDSYDLYIVLNAKVSS